MLNLIVDLFLFLVLIALITSIALKKNPFPFRSLALWGASVLLIECILLTKSEQSAFIIYYYFPLLILWGITYFSIKQEKRRLLIGFLTNVSILATIFLITAIGLSFKSPLVVILFLLIGMAIFFSLTFGGYALVVFLFWNAKEVLNRESRSIANMLTLFLGVFGIVLLVAWHFQESFSAKSIMFWVYDFFLLLFCYYCACFLTVLTSTILCNLMKPKMNQDFIIVLGAGLLNGETVTPLLAKRIDTAISFMKKQLQITGKQATLIMSGGQGHDELVPESVAMKNYATSQGVEEQYILIEDKSTTTWENLKFSQQIMTEKIGGTYHSCFVSNEYHIFRAGIFAKKLGLKSDGLGSKTAFYYLPNAFIREFVAIILMNKKRHIFANLLILLLIVSLAILKIFFVK